MPSVYDCFEETSIDIMVVTETWFYECAALERLMINSEKGNGIKMVNFCRKRKGKVNSGGGVSILYRESRTRVSEYKMKRRGHEVVIIRAKLANNTRPLYVIGAYLSTRLSAAKGAELLALINEGIHKIKSENANPYIIVAGDFNRWGVEKSYEDFEDLERLATGPTRGTATLDHIATNFNECSRHAVVLPPLVNDENERTSDHGIILAEFELKHVHEFRKYVFWTRNMRNLKDCIHEINTTSWELPEIGPDPDEYVETFHRKLLQIMDRHIPLKKRTKKSTDVPWFNGGIGKKMKQGREVYMREGRSRNWKEIRAASNDMLSRARESFYDRNVKKMSTRNNVAYNAVKKLRQVDAQQPWQPADLRPGSTVEEVGEEMANFYAKISQEFQPLEKNDTPTTHTIRYPDQTAEEIATRLRKMTLPKSYVTYDPPPKIIKACAPVFARLIAPVINKIGDNQWWPKKWKSEEVTVIPKKPQPENFDQCRNISCTSIFSKLAETYMIQEIQREIKLADNQYGGSKGCGTTHLLCDLTTAIMQEIEDGECAVSLMAVDFAKAFNRMNHSHCLRALARKGASTGTISKVAAFLQDREMRIRQGSHLSSPRPTPGGAPQGTKSGNLLFSIATDHIGEIPLTIPTPKYPATTNAPQTPPDRNLEESLNVNYFDVRTRGGTMRIDDTIGDPDVWERHEVEAALHIVGDLSRMKNFKYVDDLTVVEGQNTVTGIRSITAGKEERRLHAQGLELRLQSIHEESAEIGMELHPDKTQLLCISPAVNSEITSFIRTGGTEVESSSEMKILGYRLGQRPNADAHVKHIKKGFIGSSWLLRHLKRAKVPPKHITSVYCSMIRSQIEYSSVVYGGFLTGGQSDELERLQATSLGIIWGWNRPYEELLATSGLESLKKRRGAAFERFTVKAYRDPAFRKRWFPERQTIDHNLRHRRPVQEEKAKQDRLQKSPIYRMRKLINDMIADGRIKDGDPETNDN